MTGDRNFSHCETCGALFENPGERYSQCQTHRNKMCRVFWCIDRVKPGWEWCPQHLKRPPKDNLEDADHYRERVFLEDAEARSAERRRLSKAQPTQIELPETR